MNVWTPGHTRHERLCDKSKFNSPKAIWYLLFALLLLARHWGCVRFFTILFLLLFSFGFYLIRLSLSLPRWLCFSFRFRLHSPGNSRPIRSYCKMASGETCLHRVTTWLSCTSSLVKSQSSFRRSPFCCLTKNIYIYMIWYVAIYINNACIALEGLGHWLRRFMLHLHCICLSLQKVVKLLLEACEFRRELSRKPEPSGVWKVKYFKGNWKTISIGLNHIGLELEHF